MCGEKWDILDANGKPTGRTTFRGHCTLKSGEYHLVVHIWVVSQDGRVLIQKRSANKKLMPGEWAATGGAAMAGETSFAAASRELFEELGIPSTPNTLTKLLRIKKRNSLQDIWIIENNTPAENLVLQKSEVAAAKWVTVDNLLQMIENGEFHNYGKEYCAKVFPAIQKKAYATV